MEHPTQAQLLPPSVTFRGTEWSVESLAGNAADWHARLAKSIDSRVGAIAAVMPSHPESIALLFALSGLSIPVVLLHPDPASWRSAPPFPGLMPVVLTPAAAEFERPLREAGLATTVLPAISGRGRPWPPFLSTPGFVIFTSGSTGVPKPTFRSTRGLLQAAGAIAATYRLPRGARVAGCLPLATSFGLTQNVVLPAMLGGCLSLLERFDHRSLLNLFAETSFDYWPGTALMADLLVRAPLGTWRGRAPAICHVSSGHLPVQVYRRFLGRFGVPLRQSYGRSECSFITAETAPIDGIQPETVGYPTAGVELCCGETPETPLPAGASGRIWIRCPWHSEGYGYPPDLEPSVRADGWAATEDVGYVTAAGRLVILGRVDDCFKTAGGFLVSPPLVAGVLREHPDVVDASVVPVQGRSGIVIGVLVAAREGLERAEIHALARQALPAWLHPAVVAIRRDIPDLATGKHDRAACIRLLEAEMAASPGTDPA
ncbi:MAG TPA: class I adenylate-forming enzyme family protein [Candidatus Deferrimicrobiaceae bacterium]|nr:class I adenylate-forming enzyme family protein [Candidatus Deferrimicrobiaceae bacterium]